MNGAAQAAGVPAAQFGQGHTGDRKGAGGPSLLHSILQGDDQKFWFYNSMHFPEPMSSFDMITAEAAYCALARPTPGCIVCDHAGYRSPNHQWPGCTSAATAVTDLRRSSAARQSSRNARFYYYENWEPLYEQWKQKMLKLIEDAIAMPDPALS